MRTLKIIEHISLDGVIQHSADDDDFPYSEWTAPYRTTAGRDAMLAAYGERFDLMLGRRTYARRLVVVESGHTDMTSVARKSMTGAIGQFFAGLGWIGQGSGGPIAWQN